MKVSIVTISFNQAVFLPACIESVIGQDYDDIEYIIVDAGSTDGSREIINHYKAKVAQVIFESDDGPADGLNKGFGCATGDIFCYINADDILLPGAISSVVENFCKSPDTDVLYGNGYRLDENGCYSRKLFSMFWGLKRYAYGASSVVQQATFFRREIFLKAGRFNLENAINWDGELLVDMALAGGVFTKSSAFLGGFRIYSGSITGSGLHKSQSYLDTCQRISEKILGRPLTSKDRVFFLLYRIAKYARHPVATFHGVAWKIKRLFPY